MNIRYEETRSPALTSELILQLFEAAGIGKPNWTLERVKRSLHNSQVVISAWDESVLIGLATAITDFAWIGYLSQLAVNPAYQGRGIGKELVARVVKETGKEVSLVVHSAEGAKNFYEACGFVAYSNVYKLNRKY